MKRTVALLLSVLIAAAFTVFPMTASAVEPDTDECSVWLYLRATDPEPIAGVDVKRGEVFGPIAEPGRTNAVFQGWYLNRELTVPYDPTKPIMQDTYIFAGWEVLYLIGDVNNDDVVNGADAGLLSRYASGWSGYYDKIKNMVAADINNDDKVNGADAGILARYTSDWDQVRWYFY